MTIPSTFWYWVNSRKIRQFSVFFSLMLQIGNPSIYGGKKKTPATILTRSVLNTFLFVGARARNCYKKTTTAVVVTCPRERGLLRGSVQIVLHVFFDSRATLRCARSRGSKKSGLIYVVCNPLQRRWNSVRMCLVLRLSSTESFRRITIYDARSPFDKARFETLPWFSSETLE